MVRIALRATTILTVGLAILLAPAPATAALIPAPGTGHGVLGRSTPAEEGASLKFSPGVGAESTSPCEASPLLEAPQTPGNVGLPVSLCIGQFPTAAIQVTITPPRGPIIRLRDQTIASGSRGVGVTMLVTPSPPVTGYRITDDRGVAAEGSLRGDGSGTYTVNARGGDASASTTFVLEPAPTPRVINLTAVGPAVAPGGRLQFGVAGKKPLSKFEVGIFGPDGQDLSGNDAYPLRTVVVARANKKGEAVIAVDTLASCPTGEFVAVLDPQTPLEDAGTFGPRAVRFGIKVPTRD